LLVYMRTRFATSRDVFVLLSSDGICYSDAAADDYAVIGAH
jgi:hypothetical protein